jgi:hypothetical protein
VASTSPCPSSRGEHPRARPPSATRRHAGRPRARLRSDTPRLVDRMSATAQRPDTVRPTPAARRAVVTVRASAARPVPRFPASASPDPAAVPPEATAQH